MNNELNLVEALRYARHDWMNKLQLIKGNLDLERIDRAKQVIQEIVAEAQNESKLSNLRMPQFTEWMLTYNWRKHYIKMEFEVLQADSTDVDDDRLYKWFTDFFSVLENSVKPYEENNMVVTINISQQEARFELDFNGIIVDKESLKKWIETDYSSISLHTLNSEVLLMTLSINT